MFVQASYKPLCVWIGEYGQKTLNNKTFTAYTNIAVMPTKTH